MNLIKSKIRNTKIQLSWCFSLTDYMQTDMTLRYVQIIKQRIEFNCWKKMLPTGPTKRYSFPHLHCKIVYPIVSSINITDSCELPFLSGIVKH